MRLLLLPKPERLRELLLPKLDVLGLVRELLLPKLDVLGLVRELVLPNPVDVLLTGRFLVVVLKDFPLTFLRDLVVLLIGVLVLFTGCVRLFLLTRLTLKPLFLTRLR